MEQAHEDAVDAAIAYLEDAALLCAGDEVAASAFPALDSSAGPSCHRKSRASDPDLHSHVVVADMTQAPDGEWSALFGRAMFRHARTAGAVYQAVLRHGLTERLEVGFGACQRGVERSRACRRGVGDCSASDGWRSRRRWPNTAPASSAGRRSPRSTHGREADRHLRSCHATELAGAGQGDRLRVKSVPCRTRPEAAAIPDGERGRLLTEHDAAFDRRAALRAVADGAIEGLAYPGFVARADGFLASDDALEVSPGRWSTPEMLAIEADALRLACAAGPVRALPGGWPVMPSPPAPR